VHRSGAQARRPLTSPAATASSITPSAAANGIRATAAARSGLAVPSFSLTMSSSARAPVSVDGYHPPGHDGNHPIRLAPGAVSRRSKDGKGYGGGAEHPAGTSSAAAGPRMDLLVDDGATGDQPANL